MNVTPRTHHLRTTPKGDAVKLRIVDDLNPEDLAMLQALYSRSAESVDVHLEKVKSTGSGKFMEKYYVGSPCKN